MFPTRTRLVACAAFVLLFGCSNPDETNNAHHDDNHDHGDVGHAHEGDADHALPDLSGVDFGADVTLTEAAASYCECLLIRCHDPFHEKYGVDDADAIGACEVEASAFPVTGTPQTSGDSIECRQGHCETADDDATCADALGAACTP